MQKLKEYRAKRSFSATAEPAGELRGRTNTSGNSFVVQKHAARRLHYDFRLEMDGVLKSWAVPKGFPVKKGDRRLAVEVEDHPLEYGRFEGTIPAGNYGAGTVMLWDRGTYEVSGSEPVRALRDGKIHFVLHGKKLKSEWTLVRMRPGEDEKPQWLLLKSGENVAPISARAEDESVLTGRSLKQIAGAEGEIWVSNRAAKTTATKSHTKEKKASPQRTAVLHGRSLVTQLQVDLKRMPRARPEFIEPMKALLVDELPKGPQWLYEIKFDGVRALAIKTKSSLQLISRTGKELGSKYSEVLEALRSLPASEAVLDGEVVAMDEQGRSSFQLLQSSQLPGTKRPPLFYYVFDLLNLEGKDLTGLPLYQRKALAQTVVAELKPAVLFSAGIKADSERVMREMRARGLEGLIAKQTNSKYESGRRSGAWRKYKWTTQQEFVIGGFS